MVYDARRKEESGCAGLQLVASVPGRRRRPGESEEYVSLLKCRRDRDRCFKCGKNVLWLSSWDDQRNRDSLRVPAPARAVTKRIAGIGRFTSTGAAANEDPRGS